MKKLSFFLGAAAVLMTACQSDEIVDQARTRGIGFDTFVDKSTRATDTDDITGETLQSFNVWGITFNPDTKAGVTRVFDRQEVTKNAETGKWEYSPLRFWVIGNNYRFTGIAPVVDESKLSVEYTDATADFEEQKGAVKITFDNRSCAAATDLCYAFNRITNVTASQTNAGLIFNHMLSRVKFTFHNTFPSAKSAISISDVQIKDAVSKATIDKTKGETQWTASTASPVTFAVSFPYVRKTENVGREDMIFGGSTATAAEGGKALDLNKGETEHQYLIPVQGAKSYKVSFKVTLWNYDDVSGLFHEMETYTHTNVELPAIDYQPSYSYNFVAEINEKTIDPDKQLLPILFNPEVEPWKDFTDTDAPVKKEETPSPTPDPAA